MRRDEIIQFVCDMPAAFRERGNVSMAALLQEVGDPAAVRGISEAELEHCLRQHPHLVESWLMESADTGSSPAWYLQSSAGAAKDKGPWVVGRYPGDETHEFDNAFQACGCYIRHYVDSLCENIR